nr:aminotransferase class III-fold pyridoxal phosphate-dependent enzyme [Actinopolyspora saharensis]
MLSLDAPLSAEELTELDRTRVWHPYTTSPTASPQLLVESASGVRLRLAAPVRGVEELVDGMSSWWAAVHGYAHPELDAAAHAQVDRMSHVMFGGLTNESAVRLAATLTEITPRGAEPRLPRRLGVGVGGGRAQDVLAVLARTRASGQAAAADLARRLPR